MGAVLGSYTVGYFVWTALLAPRVIALHRARQHLSRVAPPVGVSTRVQPPGWLTLLGGAPVASEHLMGWIQFVALILGVYVVGRGYTTKALTLPKTAPSPVKAPHFGATTTVVANLVSLWRHHRGGLFVTPLMAALQTATVGVLIRLGRPTPPTLLPRLLRVVPTGQIDG